MVFMTTGLRVAAAARGWLGTRCHHQGRLKKNDAHKGGVDCLGLLVGVAKELHLQSADGKPLAEFDEIHYSHSPDSKRLQAHLAQALTRISPAAIMPGDIVLLRIDDNPQHLAIVSEQGLIHAYAPARAVVEHALDDWWRQRIEAAYRLA